MANEKDIPLFPISQWDIGPIPTHGLIAFRPHFLSHALQKPHEAQADRYYALTPEQCRQLVEDLQRQLARLETAGVQVPPGQKH